MYNNLGKSIYLSSLKTNRVSLDNLSGDTPVFISLHISEEFDDNYNNEIEKLCNELNKKNCKILADISKKTLKQFNLSVDELVKKLNLYCLRIDYGFDTNEMIEMVKKYPLALNASTIQIDEINQINKHGQIFAMHNFYPRKETGLDEEYFNEINNNLKKHNIKVIAFIPGEEKRGPLFEGLPTLEKHRFIPSYVAYLEMIIKYNVDQVYVGDVSININEEKMINTFIKDNIISLPVILDKEYEYLYDKVFTNRIDSPSNLIRIIESREYSCIGENIIKQNNSIERLKGSITIDNELYKRYCGEIQITKQDFKQDDKVNVIGKVKEEYIDILDLINRNDKFMFVR